MKKLNVFDITLLIIAALMPVIWYCLTRYLDNNVFHIAKGEHGIGSTLGLTCMILMILCVSSVVFKLSNEDE